MKCPKCGSEDVVGTAAVSCVSRIDLKTGEVFQFGEPAFDVDDIFVVECTECWSYLEDRFPSNIWEIWQQNKRERELQRRDKFPKTYVDIVRPKRRDY